jgi:hypothetical protein
VVHFVFHAVVNVVVHVVVHVVIDALYFIHYHVSLRGPRPKSTKILKLWMFKANGFWVN